ncbi:MAG: lysine 2,3-aminomutase [Caldilineaceae bacterium]|nr:lysine 2,3-aminomutase [Caldilineaceae bacterium]MBP8106168.1 lysine 2,3-aminomutase [Caldilineaceae bacterium]MBP8122254.1 lysine 2,3-aminomutase [Caldilineaceae bacterium]
MPSQTQATVELSDKLPVASPANGATNGSAKIDPAVTPPYPWQDVPMAKWNDWRWQLTNRLNSVEEMAKVVNLTEDEMIGLSAPGRFRVDITPYFASLMDRDDPNCPVRLQIMPTAKELVPFTSEMADSLNEDAHSPVPGLVHRYPDRVLMLVTTQCASYCRYCTRSRIVGDPSAQFSRTDYDAQIEYLQRTPQVRDVLLSGGDPLTIPPKVLEDLLRRLRAIPHIEIIRIGSRVPVFMPQRITPELVEMLRQFHPLWLNTHFNHAKEITPEVQVALARMADAGIPLGCQTVLLAGVNDCPNIMKELMHKLVMNRVRPYYIYQCDLVHGAGHFRTPVATGIEIMEHLRGHTSGYAVPTYVVDAPGGGGKIPVMPNYVVTQSADRVVLRNYEGFITAYTQPEEYKRHDPATCPDCQKRAKQSGEAGQEGLAGLLAGERMSIAPEGFNTVHQRLSN